MTAIVCFNYYETKITSEIALPNLQYLSYLYEYMGPTSE
jgi:hypothetical protein